MKTTLHRARRALAAYDAAPCRPTPELRARVQELLLRFALAAATQDPKQIARLLEEDAELASDADGEFVANARPLRGAGAIARFYAAQGDRLGRAALAEVRSLNGLPAFVIALGDPGKKNTARRFVTAPIPGEAGRIARILTVVATPKLRCISFAPTEPDGSGAG